MHVILVLLIETSMYYVNSFIELTLKMENTDNNIFVQKGYVCYEDSICLMLFSTKLYY